MINHKYSYSGKFKVNICKILLQKSILLEPIPVAAWSKAWVCSHSLAGIAGSNPAWGTDVYLL